MKFATNFKKLNFNAQNDKDECEFITGRAFKLL